MTPSPSSSGTLVFHIDGASRGNPGPAAYAVVAEDAAGHPVAAFSKTLGRTTNNFAEYQALLAALRYALEQKHPDIKIFSDSELLVRQIQGRYKVNHEDLKPLYAQALEMIGELGNFSIRHVPREQNREADRLANEALDGTAKNFHHRDTETQSKNREKANNISSEGQDGAKPDCADAPVQPSAEAIPARLNELSRIAVDAAYKVHSALGPGLLESVYETCMAHELKKCGLFVEQQIAVPICYDGLQLEAAFRLDLLIEKSLIIELKSVEVLLPIHAAQMLTYLKLTGCRLGLLINFNVHLIRDGIKRIVL